MRSIDILVSYPITPCTSGVILMLFDHIVVAVLIVDETWQTQS